jgi:hypothetical protein
MQRGRIVIVDHARLETPACERDKTIRDGTIVPEWRRGGGPKSARAHFTTSTTVNKK